MGTNKTRIQGKNKATLEQMIKFVNKVNAEFDQEIAESFLKISPIYNIRGDIAFCQAVHETNWFRFGGDVHRNQNNFGGLGATGGVRGIYFSTVEEGVRAQIQHLYAYASTEPLPDEEKLVDSRFNLVKRGVAPYWIELSGRWAYPGYDREDYESLEDAMEAEDTYGHKILELYEEMVKVAKKDKAKAQGPLKDVPEWKKEGVKWLYEEGLLNGENWKGQIGKPLPLWAQAIVLKRLAEKMKK